MSKSSCFKTIIAGLALALAMLVSPLTAKADMTSEAVEINLNQAVTGYVAKGQTNYYKFKTGSELSSFTLTASRTDGYYADVIICDEWQTKQCSLLGVNSDEKKITVKLNSNQYYYVKVVSSSDYWDSYYTFCVKDQRDEADDLEHAGEIALNTRVKGEIVNSRDEDWFKFKTEQQNASYVLDATADGWYSTYFSIVDETGTVAGRIYAGTEGRSANFKLKADTYYYVKVENNEDASYSFQVNSVPDEPDTMQTAKKIDITKLTKGDICVGDDIDEDWFQFETKIAGNYTFSGVGIDEDVSIYVYNRAQKQLLYLYADETGSTGSVYLPAGKTYYICVKSDYISAYSFSASVKKVNVPKASIKSVTSKYGYVYVKISEKNVDGYEIACANNKKMKGATVSDLDDNYCEFGSLKKNKTYYMKVRSYKIVSDKKVYAGWSKVKSVKVK